MSHGVWMARLAAVAASTMGTVALAAEPASAGGPERGSAFDLSLDYRPAYLAETLPDSRAPGAPPSLNTSRAPLMSLLDKVGVAQSLDAARINIYGHIEVSYNYNFDDPAGNLNLGREFEFNNNRFQMNQLDLTIERRADLKQWDAGFLIEMMYGTDARLIHASGIVDYGNGNNSSGVRGPEYQFDPTQIAFDFTVPWENGLRIRVGKFLFFKQVDPNASVFFTHSFTFGAALPFTLTGATVFYPISKDLSIEGGFSRGWGQGFTDNNGAIDAMARVRYKLANGWDTSLAVITGPELDDDNSHYRTVLDGTISFNPFERDTVMLDAIYGYQALPSSGGGSAAHWYGISAYNVYTLSDRINLNARAEVYRDEEGFTTGVSQTLYEVTLGATLTPFPDSMLGSNFKVRPEVRLDYSSKRYFDGLTRHDQWTFAIDAYYDF